MNLTNIVVALAITGAVAGTTIPKIQEAKYTAIAQNISNVEIEYNNMFEAYEAQNEGAFGALITGTGWQQSIADFAFNGDKDNIVLPKVNGVNDISNTANGDGGWIYTFDTVNSKHTLTPDFIVGSQEEQDYNEVKPTPSVIGVWGS